MAGGQERILRERIRSIQATKKITRAMELIAASRIVKAQARVTAAVPYSDQITEVVKDLAASGASSDSPLLAGRGEIKKTCYVVITADRGLCGGYNSGSSVRPRVRSRPTCSPAATTTIIPVGRKAEGYFRFRGYKLGQAFNGFSDQPDLRRRPGDRRVRRRAVHLAARSTRSSSSTPASSRPARRKSCSGRSCRCTRETVTGGDGQAAQRRRRRGAAAYEFEPDPTTILDTLAPALRRGPHLRRPAQRRGVRARLPPAGDEVATDNAEELIKNLSRIMNRARQDSITTEIMEIVSGAEALGSGTTDLTVHRLVDLVRNQRTPGADQHDDDRRRPAPTPAARTAASSASPAR